MTNAETKIKNAMIEKIGGVVTKEKLEDLMQGMTISMKAMQKSPEDYQAALVVWGIMVDTYEENFGEDALFDLMDRI